MRGLLATALNNLTHEVRALTHAIVSHKSRTKAATKRDLEELEIRIMAQTQKEIATQLKEVTATVAKIGSETTTLIDKVAALEAAVANQPEVTPELAQAVVDLRTQADVVDNLVPDQTPAPAQPS